ncbi:MAG TPA: hypothetical protein VG816_11915 [Solirubrobacterales bacterium]|nr:hypothetical protein [Solirubrobacterales bacterium]
MANATAEYLADRDFVLAKCRYFVDAQVWPRQTLFPELWLENFTEAEQPYAVHLLNQFLFFCDPLVDALLLGGLLELSRLVSQPTLGNVQATAKWGDFLKSAVVTFPTGEEPRPTDSGHTFARKARQVLGFSELRILAPSEAIKYLMDRGPRPVLFLDDFLGTGRQFVATWTRNLQVDGITTSFHTFSTQLAFSSYYLPLIGTTDGVRTVKEDCPGVTLSPTHTIPPQYSALVNDSLLWPIDHKENGQQVIKESSERAGIPDTEGTSASDWQGYRKLGLCLGFEHGVPDATIPLFYWKKNNWKPLLERA